MHFEKKIYIIESDNVTKEYEKPYLTHNWIAQEKKGRTTLWKIHENVATCYLSFKATCNLFSTWYNPLLQLLL